MTTAADLDEHRSALIGHCYRMLGSVTEAEDAVQETLVRAWRNLDRFEGRSALRTWLYSIATRVCLDTLGTRARRERPMELGTAGSVDDALVPLPAGSWIEPIPDAMALPSQAEPAEQAILKQSIRLAFVAALQNLPPRQRAALLLVEVLGWSAAEVAGTLEMSVAAVNSALQRARASLGAQNDGARREVMPATLSPRENQLLDAYVSAFERYDVDALTSLLHQDASFSMPPYRLWLQGPGPVRDWLLGRGAACRGSRLLPTRASGSPAFGQYHPKASGGPLLPWALIVLEISGDRISGWNSFLDTATLFPRFGLPPEL